MVGIQRYAMILRGDQHAHDGATIIFERGSIARVWRSSDLKNRWRVSGAGRVEFSDEDDYLYLSDLPDRINWQLKVGCNTDVPHVKCYVARQMPDPIRPEFAFLPDWA